MRLYFTSNSILFNRMFSHKAKQSEELVAACFAALIKVSIATGFVFSGKTLKLQAQARDSNSCGYKVLRQTGLKTQQLKSAS